MRVVVADPPAYTPPYDRSLAAALARAGADVELVTSRFRFGSVAPPDGYEVREWFYPLSSRLNGNRLRLGVKALEHPLGMARFAVREARRDPRPVARRARGRPLALPAAKPGRLHRPRHHPPANAVEDGAVESALRALRPRRRALGARARAARRLRPPRREAPRHRAPGLPLRRGARRRRAHRPLSRAHPSVQGDRGRRGDGARRRRRPAPRGRGSARAARRSPQRTPGTARSGDSDTSRRRSCAALSRRRPSRSFPTGPRSTSPERCCRCSGPAFPPSSTTSAGSARSSGRFGAGAVVPPGDVESMSAALRRLLGDADALASARRGAEHAREELTWDASAAAHLELYREIA